METKLPLTLFGGALCEHLDPEDLPGIPGWLARASAATMGWYMKCSWSFGSIPPGRSVHLKRNSDLKGFFDQRTLLFASFHRGWIVFELESERPHCSWEVLRVFHHGRPQGDGQPAMKW